MTSEEYGQYIDDFELGADVMPGESLTDYIERRRREFDSKADGGVIGIEVKIADEMAKGGRVGLVSGGALKGLANLFKRKGDDVIEIAKQEEIFRKGPITTDFLNKVDDSIVSKFVRTRDTKGPGSYGMYDNFDDMPAGLKAAEILKRFVDPKTGKINYEDAEFFIGRKLKGDETIDELINIAISKPIGTGKGPVKDFEEYVLNPAKKADGGRVGLFMGGPALTGQALSIYNSMNAYGFSDQEIADALSARGLYGPGSTKTTTPVINTAPNIINQGGGDGPPNDPPKDPYGGLGYSSANFGLGKGINKDAVMDYEADAYKVGRTFTGQLNKIGLGIFSALKNIPTPFNLVRKGIEFAKQKEIEKQEIADAIARDNFREAMRQGQGFYDSLNEGRGASVSQQSREQAGAGYDSVEQGSPFAKGGLATMFTRRR